MGQTVHALIEHSLTPEEILKLPYSLQHLNDDLLGGIWCWSRPNMDKQTLADLWIRKAEYFINNSWSKQDLVLLEKTEMSLHFFNPNLVTFENHLPWLSYNEYVTLRTGFNHLTKVILSLLNAVDVLFVPDLSSVGFFEEETIKVDEYRKKANGNNLYAVELD